MRAAILNGNVLVVLSRRNILALLHKLDDPSSARTLVRACGNGLDLTLMVEDDETHYVDRNAGEMSPSTERFIAEYGQKEDRNGKGIKTPRPRRRAS